MEIPIRKILHGYTETSVWKCLYGNSRTGITEGLFEKEGSDQVKELSLLVGLVCTLAGFGGVCIVVSRRKK